MRLYLKLTKNIETIPFNYQPYLTGAIHKWIGKNNLEHDKLSLYSFSWLQHVTPKNKGINLTSDSYFFISAYHEELIKQILKGILENPSVCFAEKGNTVELQMPKITFISTYFGKPYVSCIPFSVSNKICPIE